MPRLRFGHADGELLVDCQSLAEGVSGAIACARMMAVRSNPVTGMMQIPPSARRRWRQSHLQSGDKQASRSEWIHAEPRFPIG